MSLKPFHYPLPKKTMERFVRLIFEPIERGQSLVLLFSGPKAGRRALPKFLMTNLSLFKKQIKKGPENYLFYYIDPPELIEQTARGYLLLFYQEITGGDFPSQRPSSRFEVLNSLKKIIKKEIAQKELIFFLNQFDELPFMDKSLANNLKALWQLNKTKVHFVFLPFEDISQPNKIKSYGELNEVIMENTVKLPSLSQKDIDYIISRYSSFLNYKFKPEEISAIKEISKGNPYLIKTACRILSQEKQTRNPKKFLTDHYQIQLLKEEEKGGSKILEVNPQTGIITLAEKPVHLHLAGKEYELLAAFLKQQNQIISRDKIADILWGKESYEKYSNWAIDQIISQLRKKLDSIGKKKNLETIRDKGYRYQED